MTTEELRSLVGERLITKTQIAGLLKLTRQAVDRRIVSGKLPQPLCEIGPLAVFDKEEVLRFAKRR
jgi:hypothetical protein